MYILTFIDGSHFCFTWLYLPAWVTCFCSHCHWRFVSIQSRVFLLKFRNIRDKYDNQKFNGRTVNGKKRFETFAADCPPMDPRCNKEYNNFYMAKALLRVEHLEPHNTCGFLQRTCRYCAAYYFHGSCCNWVCLTFLMEVETLWLRPNFVVLSDFLIWYFFCDFAAGLMIPSRFVSVGP